MLILGISDLEHNTAAALLDGDTVVSAIEEEKLSRTPITTGVPQLAIEQCLKQAGAKSSELSLTAMAGRPKRAWLRDEGGRLTAFVAPHGLVSYPRDGHDGLFWKLSQSKLLRQSLGPRTPLLNVEHHLCHAASTFYPSPFERALVMTLDQCGDMWSGLLAVGEGNKLHVLRPIRFPNSLGWFYSSVTEILGFRPGRDEHKVQWLSKEGSPDFVEVFRKLFARDHDGLPALDLAAFADKSGRFGFPSKILEELQIKEPPPLRDTRLAARIARSAQEFVQETVVEIADQYRRKTDEKYLCVAGGLLLNVLLVRALEEQAGFDKVFVQAVSGNAGTALGAALLGRKRLQPEMKRQPLSHLYLGPASEESEMKSVLDNCKTIYRYLPSENQLLDETVRLLKEDKIVAWCQGRAEFGHRALGNRSILASPFSPYVMENLNNYVKHREDFHPFALSVTAEKAPHLFCCSDNCRFMASIGRLTEEGSRQLLRFAFNGNSVRIHTVHRSVNPRFWNLLQRFGELSAAPVLVNTSFNLFGEPLVCGPREAIRSFYCSGIDALVMGNFLIVKP